MKIKEFKKEAQKKDIKALQRDLDALEKTYFSEMTHESMREKKNPAKMEVTSILAGKTRFNQIKGS